MSSPFRTILGLDAFEDRLTPSAAPITEPESAYAEASAARAVAPAPYVIVDFDGCDHNKDGRTDHITQLLVQVDFEDGSSVSVYVTVRLGQTTASVALSVAAALQAEGVDCTVNGGALNIRGRNGAAVENVSIQVTGSDVDKDSPYLHPPYVDPHNGATASSVINLPR